MLPEPAPEMLGNLISYPERMLIRALSFLERSTDDIATGTDSS